MATRAPGMLAARNLLPPILSARPLDSSRRAAHAHRAFARGDGAVGFERTVGPARQSDAAFLQMQAEQRDFRVQVARRHRECHAWFPKRAAHFGRQRTGAAHLRQLRNPPGDRREIAQFDFRLAAQSRILFAHGDAHGTFEYTLVDQRATQLRLSAVARQVGVDAEVAVREAQRILAFALRHCAAGGGERGLTADGAVGSTPQFTLALENAFDSDRRVGSRQSHQHGEGQRIEGIVDGELLAGPIAGQAQRRCRRLSGRLCRGSASCATRQGAPVFRSASGGTFEASRRSASMRPFHALALEGATRLERHTQSLAARIEFEAMRALIAFERRRWPRRTQSPRASRRAP